MRSDLDKYASAKPACQKIADTLLSITGASRITYRIGTSTPGLLPVFVESLASTPAGFLSLLVQPDIDLRQAETFAFVVGEKKILLHNDCLDSRIASPQVLVEKYGAKSQMLLPAFVDGEVFSMVSVHEAKGVRDWEKEKAEDGRSMVQVLIQAGKDFLEALGVKGTVPSETDIDVA
ncbi:hypothetical protein NA57DRAFT_81241 [Rhizodiscina lignyota]|uniref:GAF domain-containing protein n=1 Tax=Rhizodiscina lignyota TaxID=1504668 RepID=A0A9P4I7A5_9PEZI|nr:hypothetical protein NA57DRAFT_81241 [Rhizodiscina lignyota]